MAPAPIVRAVGGLGETVFDRDVSDRPRGQRNGYVFHQPDQAGIESAPRRAIGLWYAYPQAFRDLMLNGMRSDYSWNYPGQDYVNIYEYIRHTSSGWRSSDRHPAWRLARGRVP